MYDTHETTIVIELKAPGLEQAYSECARGGVYDVYMGAKPFKKCKNRFIWLNLIDWYAWVMEIYWGRSRNGKPIRLDAWHPSCSS